MAKKMGKYCKAYYLSKFREYPRWKENTENSRIEKKTVDGKEVEEQRTLTDESILYLQENYVVTDDTFLDEYIIFDDITPEWIEFCKNALEFEIPVYDEVKKPEEKAAQEKATAE